MKLVVSFCFIVLAAPLLAKAPAVNDIINRARATVGTEEALDGLVTLSVIGQVNPADPKLPETTVMLVARKPNSQRLEVRMDDMVETTITHGTSGCVIRSNIKEDVSQMRPLSQVEFDRIRHSTKQLFSYYRPDYKNGEKVRYAGITQRRGIRCHKLVYAYPQSDDRTVRFFSVNDDTLVSTIKHSNGKRVEVVDIGRQMVGGIRFPERQEYFEGEKKLHTFKFRMVEANRSLKAGLFDVPVAPKPSAGAN